MVKSRVIAKKQQKKQQQRPTAAKRGEETLEQAMARAHALIARQEWEQAVQVLESVLPRDAEGEARELLGVVECEQGEVEKGREHLLQLLSLHPTRASATPHLYLAQTAPTPRDALASYEAALTILQGRLDALQRGETAGGEEETEEEVKKECVMVFVAMVEIWMSDLCFEPDAPTQCNALITRALQLSPHDPDALLTLASIRMSESRPAEAREIVVAVADRVTRIAEHLEAKEDTAVVPQEVERDLELPPIQTRGLLARLLLEHEEYTRALRMVETIRGEDDEDVEGCYLEGWGWYCRGKALEEGAVKDTTEAGATVDECYVEALSALLECQSLHAQQDHPDEGILVHVNELVAELEGKGVRVEMEDDGEDDVEMQ